MQLKPDKLADLEEGLRNNGIDYGNAVYMFAFLWAGAMEREIAKGHTVESCARACASEANENLGTYRMTGFQYGCAVSMLADWWEHGEELRIWHNLDTQIADEGEHANESGGVLNPAMMIFEVKK